MTFKRGRVPLKPNYGLAEGCIELLQNCYRDLSQTHMHTQTGCDHLGVCPHPCVHLSLHNHVCVLHLCLLLLLLRRAQEEIKEVQSHMRTPHVSIDPLLPVSIHTSVNLHVAISLLHLSQDSLASHPPVAKENKKEHSPAVEPCPALQPYHIAVYCHQVTPLFH